MSGALGALANLIQLYLGYCTIVMAAMLALTAPLLTHDHLVHRHPRYQVRLSGWDSYSATGEEIRYFLTRLGGWRWMRRQALDFKQENSRWAENIIELDEPFHSCTLYAVWDPPSEDGYEAEVSMTLTPLAA